MPSHLAFSFGFLNNFACSVEYWNKYYKLSFGTVFLQDYKYHRLSAVGLLHFYAECNPCLQTRGAMQSPAVVYSANVRRQIGLLPPGFVPWSS